MNPVTIKNINETLREGLAGADAVFIAVLKKDGVYYHEFGSIIGKTRLLATLKRRLRDLTRRAL